MRRSRVRDALVLAVVSVIAWSFASLLPDTATLAGQISLINGGFEGDYIAQDGIPQILVPEQGWRAFWMDRGQALPPWAVPGGSPAELLKRPEYKPLTRDVDEKRVRSGETSQCLFSPYGVLIGGLFTVVDDVPEGAYVEALVHAQSWASAKHNPAWNEGGDMFATVCIDPKGGTDPWSIRLQCAEWTWVPEAGSDGNWADVCSPVVKVLEGKVSVFILGHGRWATVHNDLYLDDAEVRLVDGPGGVAPTYTPYPTYTAYPTYTPKPNETPAPGAGPSLEEIKEAVGTVVTGVVAGRDPVVWPR